jgi:hypothetical protein
LPDNGSFLRGSESGLIPAIVRSPEIISYRKQNPPDTETTATVNDRFQAFPVECASFLKRAIFPGDFRPSQFFKVRVE